MNDQSRLGLLLTVFLLCIGLLIFYYRNFISLSTGLDPNEVGDFLAGLFSPIALSWLVLEYYQQAKELSENTKALKKQGDEANKHTIAFNNQLEILTFQLSTHERSVFLDSYKIRYNELAFRVASIVRASYKDKRWEKNIEWFGLGYTDVFCNGLKNEYLRLGSKEFLKLYDECFNDNRNQLKYYIKTFDDFSLEAEKIDKNIRRVIEMSGLGAAYVAICSMLEHKVKLKYRKIGNPEQGPLINTSGTRK